jgi:nifU domain protein
MEDVMTHEDVQKAIDGIRPMLQADGGDIALDSIKDNVVYVKLHGACGACPMATYTLKLGVEAKLKEQFPELQEVVAV